MTAQPMPWPVYQRLRHLIETAHRLLWQDTTDDVIAELQSVVEELMDMTAPDVAAWVFDGGEAQRLIRSSRRQPG